MSDTKHTRPTERYDEAEEHKRFQAWAAQEWATSNPPHAAWLGWKGHAIETARQAPASPDAPDLIVEAVKVMEELIGASNTVHVWFTNWATSVDDDDEWQADEAIFIARLAAARDFIAKAKEQGHGH